MKVRRLDANGDVCFGHGASDWLTDADAVAQCCYTAAKLTLGNWFLDTTLGLAWSGQPAGQPSIFDRPFDQAFAESELKRVVIETQGVSTITSFDFEYDSVARTAEATINILTIYGAARTIVVRSDS